MTDVTIAAAKLDKKSRDALPEDQFAVPGKRKLPIHDEHHARLAWDMVDRTGGLTTAERAAARRRIIERAKELGINTKDWNKVKAMQLECMSLSINLDDEHPNKMPFSGVLTKLDESSDFAPGGSNGKKIIVTADAARKALASLLGMAVDLKPSLDGHDARNKIGLITSADIVGNEIRIEGFVYAADFPEAVHIIQKLKSDLGFSFEAQRLKVEDMSADILTITELVFTGAAILFKDKAAYTTTSLAASATTEDFDMTAEELKAILDAAIKPITDRLSAVETSSATIVKDLNANAHVRALVEPQASTLETAADAMECAGIGADPKFGHASALRRMAGSLRAEAALGKVPSIWRDHDYPSYASADKTQHTTAAADDEAIKKLIAEAMKPLQDELASAKTKLADAEGKGRLQASQPERKTIPGNVESLLTKAHITLPAGDEKLAVAEVDKLMSAAALSMTQKIMVKSSLQKLGALQ